jgi:hypothetical protein
MAHPGDSPPRLATLTMRHANKPRGGFPRTWLARLILRELATASSTLLAGAICPHRPSQLASSKVHWNEFLKHGGSIRGGSACRQGQASTAVGPSDDVMDVAHRVSPKNYPIFIYLFMHWPDGKYVLVDARVIEHNHGRPAVDLSDQRADLSSASGRSVGPAGACLQYLEPGNRAVRTRFQVWPGRHVSVM